jgi:hypothetical protein
MANNSEQIESKLCAYIEGELDERGREEIERHLQANPHHRKLLAELAETRRMVQALPRESAPPELYEAFQAQLERSVLLDYNDGRDEPSAYRINRAPQVFAAAAIVLLAVGLGLIVYFALPTPNGGKTVAVTDGPPPLGNVPTADGAAPLVPAPTPEERSARKTGEFTRRAADSLVTTAPAGNRLPGDLDSSPPTPAASPTDPGAMAAAPTAPPLRDVADQLRSIAGGGSGNSAAEGGLFAGGTRQAALAASAEPTVVVVSANDPGAADAALRSALDRIPDATWSYAIPGGVSPAPGAGEAGGEKQAAPGPRVMVEAADPANTSRALRQASEVLRRARDEAAPAGVANQEAVASAEPQQSPQGGQSSGSDATARQGQQSTPPAGTRGESPDPRRATAPRPTQTPATAAPAPAVAGAGRQPVDAATAAPAPQPDPWTLRDSGKAPAEGAPAPAEVTSAAAADKLVQARARGTATQPAKDYGRFAQEEHEKQAADARGEVAAAASDLTGAYRVIVARNVPRSQVDALRRELSDSSAVPGQQVAVYQPRADAAPQRRALAAAQSAFGATSATQANPSPSITPVEQAKAGGAAVVGPLAAATKGDQGAELKKAAEAQLADAPATSVAADDRQEGALKPASPGAAGGGGWAMKSASQTPAAKPAATAAAKKAEAKVDASKELTIRSGDTLRVRVVGPEGDAEAAEHDVRVSDDGTLKLPQMAEVVYSDGLTIGELERHIASTMSREKAQSAATAPPPPVAARPQGGAGAGDGATAGANADVAAKAMAVPQVTIAKVVAPPAPEPAADPAVTVAAQPLADPAAEQAAPPGAAPKPMLVPQPGLSGEFGADANASATVPAADAAEVAAVAADQRVEVVFVVRQSADGAGSGSAPAAAPAKAIDDVKVIGKAEVLTLTLDDAAGPSVTEVQVAEDGTIPVPHAGRIKALGRTPAQVEADALAAWKALPAGGQPAAKLKVARPAGGDIIPPAAATPPAPSAPEPAKQ